MLEFATKVRIRWTSSFFTWSGTRAEKTKIKLTQSTMLRINLTVVVWIYYTSDNRLNHINNS